MPAQFSRDRVDVVVVTLYWLNNKPRPWSGERPTARQFEFKCMGSVHGNYGSWRLDGATTEGKCPPMSGDSDWSALISALHEVLSEQLRTNVTPFPRDRVGFEVP